MDPFAKLYMSCINLVVTDFAEANHIRAGTQAGFRPRHRLEDLTVPADYCIDKAQQLR